LTENGDIERLRERALEFDERIINSAANKENVLILSHYGPDGICGSALLCSEISLHGGHAQVRFSGQPSVRFLERTGAQKFDLVIFVDICAGLSGELSRIFGDRWLAIDHHEIDEEEMDSRAILNCFQCGFDGSTSVSSSGLCYLICEKSRNERSAFLAIVGAISDNQDAGPRKSLLSVNSKILEENSQSFNSVTSAFDLLFSGRETRPIHESISITTTAYIPGLTGNKDACLASLRGAGIELKSATRWRTIADFSEDEKQRILEAIVPHLPGTTLTVQDLVGTVFTSNSEDEFSPMRDARDFESLLNSCGRMGNPGLALQLCLRGNGELQSEADSLLNQYRTELVRCVQSIQSSEDRVVDRPGYVLYIGDGLVTDRMGGPCCRVLASSSRAKNRVVLFRVTTLEGEVKISMMKGGESSSERSNTLDLGLISRQLGKVTNGSGGGLRNVAGVRFSIAKQQEFQTAVDSLLQKKVAARN
jgi:single-stranded-DNA-specific exonuclease